MKSTRRGFLKMLSAAAVAVALVDPRRLLDEFKPKPQPAAGDYRVRAGERIRQGDLVCIGRDGTVFRADSRTREPIAGIAVFDPGGDVGVVRKGSFIIGT